MKIKIVSERDNPFFKRKDLKVDIAHVGESTPRTDDLKKELAGKYKVDESQVSVDYILTRRGIGESTARVKILNEKPAVVEEPVEKPAEKPAEKPTEKKEKQKQEEPKEKPKKKAQEKKKEKVEEKGDEGNEAQSG
jgi:ribosomal protein S24E